MINAAPSANSHLLYIEMRDGICHLLFSDGAKEIVDLSLKEVLNEICLQHGSSLAGRTASFQYYIGNIYKPCILIDERSEAVMIPTSSLDRNHAAVILYNDILRIKENQGYTIADMKNGISIELPVSVKMMRTQIKRCEKFLTSIDDRSI